MEIQRLCSLREAARCRRAALSAAVFAAVASAAAAGQGLPLGVPGRDAVRSDRLVRASIEPAALRVAAGQEAEVVVRLAIEAAWHVYWVNPGDSGVPPELEWTLPEGVVAGPPQWPRPQVFRTPHETTFGYENEVGLVVPLRVAAAMPPGEHPIAVRVRWMACREQCLVGTSQASGTVAIVPEASDAAAGEVPEAVVRWRARLPQTRWPGFEARIDPPTGAGGGSGDGAGVGKAVLRLRGQARGHRRIEFLPEDTPGVAYGGRIPALGVIEGDRFEFTVPIEIRPGDSLGQPLRAAGLLLFGEAIDDPCLAFSLPATPRR